MAVIDDLISQISDESLRRRIESEVAGLKKQKKFGLVFEEHLPECTPLYDLPIKVGTNVALKEKSIKETYVVLSIDDNIVKCINKITKEEKQFDVNEIVRVAEFGEAVYPYLKPIDSICNAPDSDLWHTLIEADNYHALQYLEYLYSGKVDCIYIDPPYNTGARDWKYNNDYVDESDEYRHSKWLSFMQKRLKLAHSLLNPSDSVLIVTIDEKEYLHLGCLLEEEFKDSHIQMVSTVINSKGVARGAEFFRVNEYIFFVRIGASGVKALPLEDVWRGNIKTSTTKEVRWGSLMRSGSGALRTDSPGCFYPIYISKDMKHFMGAGEVVPPGVDRRSVTIPEDCLAVFPIHDDGTEGRWQYSRDKFLEIQKQGFVRISTKTKSGVTFRYISEGWQNKVKNGIIKVIGKEEDESLIFDDSEYEQEFVPCNQWWIPSHNATEFGSKLLQSIIGKRFSFPKSVYAVVDALRFFLNDKKEALVLDFFAGSGTTLHAVNIMNELDGGNRRCILVTNNEVSEEEAKSLLKNGIRPGDELWDELGIARYVTWPRTICSIKGKDINGKAIKGTYYNTNLCMSDGFKTNANFFKLSFLDKNLVRLGRQFKEMIPTLWMKSGAIGPCPVIEKYNEPMYIFKENKMAVLVDEKQFNKFEYFVKNNDIRTVFFVTDYEPNYVAMANHFDGYDTYQLYRDYLDNFKINVRRG